jgi:hypothetical protein
MIHGWLLAVAQRSRLMELVEATALLRTSHIDAQMMADLCLWKDLPRCCYADAASHVGLKNPVERSFCRTLGIGMACLQYLRGVSDARCVFYRKI